MNNYDDLLGKWMFKGPSLHPIGSFDPQDLDSLASSGAIDNSDQEIQGAMGQMSMNWGDLAAQERYPPLPLYGASGQQADSISSSLPRPDPAAVQVPTMTAIWPNLIPQPYPLAPYGGPPHCGPPHYASTPNLGNFLTESTYRDPPEICGGPAYNPLHMQSTFSPTSYSGPLDSAGSPGAGAKHSSRARSMPSGSTTRGTRGNSSARGRSQGKKKEETPSLDSSSIPNPGTLSSFQPSLSQPSRSIPRSGGSRNSKPYDNPEQARELKSFNDSIWDLAKRWFILKLWRESCFFLNADEKNTTVDRCATEAYEAAITEYSDSYPDQAALISKYRLQPQGAGALAKCRKVLLPAAILYLETALEVARNAVANEYGFHDLVTAGKREVVKQLADSALHADVLDRPCIREVLVVIFFEESDSWGRTLGHLFENKFPLQVLALAVALTRVALDEWLTDTVGKQTWEQDGNVDIFNKILTCIMELKEGAVELLHEWWSSVNLPVTTDKRAQPNLDFTYTLRRTPSATVGQEPELTLTSTFDA